MRSLRIVQIEHSIIPNVAENGFRPRRHFPSRGDGAMGLEDDGKGKYVTLVSADGFEYVVDYEAACVSKMIKNLMTSAGGFSELESNTITFPEISGRCLERVCQYFYYKLRHTNSKDKLPQFPLPPEMALELLMAANYLDV